MMIAGSFLRMGIGDGRTAREKQQQQHAAIPSLCSGCPHGISSFAHIVIHYASHSALW
jgi:TPP-dependent indolepyruvate ferredoxin oxidoreductase alpha subunit